MLGTSAPSICTEFPLHKYRLRLASALAAGIVHSASGSISIIQTATWFSALAANESGAGAYCLMSPNSPATTFTDVFLPAWSAC